MSAPLDRLRDLPGGRAAALVRALPRSDAARPHAKGRVWARLRAPVRFGARIPFAVRAAAIAILLLCSIAVAGGRMHLFGGLVFGASGSGEETGGAPGALSSLPRAQGKAGVSAIGALPSSPPLPVAEASASAEPLSMTRAPENAPLESAKREGRRAVIHMPKQDDASPSPPALPTPSGSAASFGPSAARSMEEAEVVLDGLRALRKEGNPMKAQALFTQYLAKHPTGALAEDAMGYRMEAADRAGAGSTLAEMFAGQYLEAFPNGRYTTLANRLRVRAAASETK